jgi:hypothetical protein
MGIMETFNFDPKKTWLVHIELDIHSRETEREHREDGTTEYTIYIDGEEKKALHPKIEFAIKEECTLKEVEERVKGTKGIRELTVRKWKS